ncbi:hypothetical protein [Photobacterium damselae]|uniref:hypothetical protein n=1 Tax=Photobacterium damselae TaxID=38293 RepID=UPI00107652AE|nr:hypothetical protein [Photobacterium damselae]MBE8127741.1 hypothetical protein [Photobacterium damselae subsp. piscicida]MCG3826252.1 hypothetical protein [Photobacterium damselae]WIH22003.1 hypothetical protein KQY33_20215 [Photobacterium damselae]
MPSSNMTSDNYNRSYSYTGENLLNVADGLFDEIATANHANFCVDILGKDLLITLTNKAASQLFTLSHLDTNEIIIATVLKVTQGVSSELMEALSDSVQHIKDVNIYFEVNDRNEIIASIYASVDLTTDLYSNKNFAIINSLYTAIELVLDEHFFH